MAQFTSLIITAKGTRTCSHSCWPGRTGDPKGVARWSQAYLRLDLLVIQTEADGTVSEGVCRAPPAPALLPLSKSSPSCLGGDPQKSARTDHPGAACKTTATRVFGQEVTRLSRSHRQGWPSSCPGTAYAARASCPTNPLRCSLLNSAPLA